MISLVAVAAASGIIGLMVGSAITAKITSKIAEDNKFLREDNREKRDALITIRNRLKNALNLNDAYGWSNERITDEACNQLLVFRQLSEDVKKVINHKTKSFQAFGHTFHMLTPRNNGGKFQKKVA